MRSAASPYRFSSTTDPRRKRGGLASTRLLDVRVGRPAPLEQQRLLDLARRRGLGTARIAHVLAVERLEPLLELQHSERAQVRVVAGWGVRAGPGRRAPRAGE